MRRWNLAGMRWGAAVTALMLAGAVRLAPACSASLDPETLAWRGAQLEGSRAKAAPDEASRVRASMEALVALAERHSPSGAHATELPHGTRLHDVRFPVAPGDGTLGPRVEVYLQFPEDFLAGPLWNAFRFNAMARDVVRDLEPHGFSSFFFYVQDPSTGNFVDPEQLLPQEPVMPFVPEVDEASEAAQKALGIDPSQFTKAAPPVISPGQPQGALTGKTIYINQAHGWFDDVAFGRWRIQRGNCFNIIEDFSSADFMNVYMVPLLRNAGAKVQTVREMDLQTNMAIVDNADTPTGAQGSYAETGTWGTSSAQGFRQKTTASWTGTAVNPFAQGANQSRFSTAVASTTPTATATWTMTVPADGFYNVYVSWTASANRTLDAQYLVSHSGGTTEFRMNQRLDGSTWNLLGNFYFERDAAPESRRITLTNASATAGGIVVADAVRIGGGMGDVARHTHGVSGRPRWEEEAVNYLQFNGFGASGTLYTGDDDEEGGWSDRPQYARWEHSQKDGGVEDALYFAFHTNAVVNDCTGGARGVIVFRSSSSSAQSISLQTSLHDTIFQHVQGLYGSPWPVRAKAEGNYGENSQTNLGANLPGVLIEGLFHDNSADTALYADPQFRHDYARSILHGIIKYYETRDTINLVAPPEAPVNFAVEALGGSQVRLSWTAGPSGGFNGDAATSYRVFRSTNGFGFDNGTVVNGTSVTLTDLSTTAPTFFRVAAVNAGGISFPTETLVAQGGTGPSVLLVNGFDRYQRTLVPNETVTNAGTIARVDPRRFQAFNYVIEHARALAPYGLRISSSSNEPIGTRAIELTPHRAVFWIGGEESTANDSLSATEQSALQEYLAATNRGLFISGSEIAYDLDGVGSAAEKSFLNTILRATYVGDDAGTYNTAAQAAGPFAGLPAMSFAVASGARYDADSPDRLNAGTDAVVALTYSGGTGGNAAIAYDGTASSRGKVLFLGFPFETIATAPNRQAVMERALAYFGLSTATPTPTTTGTVSPSPTASPSISPSSSPSPTLSPTVATPSPSVSASPSVSPSASASPTATVPPSLSPSATASPSASPTASNSPSATPTASETPTASPTESPIPSNSPSPSFTVPPSLTPTVTPSPSPEPTATFNPLEPLPMVLRYVETREEGQRNNDGVIDASDALLEARGGR